MWGLVAAATVLVAGVFIDGNAHSTLDEIESFFTVPHAIVFAGYLACAAVVVQAIRHRLDGTTGLWGAVPDGWIGAVWGLGLFGAGFVGDGIWHTVFGIEADIDALLSPTHLLMLAGGLAVFAAPVLSQWHDPTSGATWRSLAPTVASITLIVSSISFFLVWTWPLATGVVTDGFLDYASDNLAVRDDLIDFGQITGLAGYAIFGVVLVAPLLLLAKRWLLPPGAIAVIVVVPWLAMVFAFDTPSATARLSSVVAGAAVAEWMSARLWRDRHPERWRIIAPALVATAWTTDMVVLAFRWGIGWEAEFVGGAIVLSALMVFGIALLAFPPRTP